MKDGYLNFDEYIRQGEPAQQEKAGYWQTAIGLQAVDGLKVSEYLQDTARRHIEEHSWYFRNALVRVNYRNVAKGIEHTPVYLERFFRNLLLGEQWDLRNRYLHIHPTAEWSVQSNLADPTSTLQVPYKLPNKFNTDNLYIKKLIAVVGDRQMSIKEMMGEAGLKDRVSFLNLYLNPAIKEKYARMLYPDKPNHPRQKYLLTVKGLALYQALNPDSAQ